MSSSAPSHPIHSCPDDLLRCIFEAAISSVSMANEFKLATIISHVCRRWRILATATPRLWRYISCEMTRGEEAVLAFWERASQRVKGIPAVVAIHDLDITQEYLLRCRLDAIPNLCSLALYFTQASAIKHFMHPGFVSPSQPLQLLQLHSSPFQDPYYWECDKLLDRFQGLSHLSLYGLSGVMFTSSRSFPCIRYISLSDIEEGLDLEAFSLFFPNLQILNLSRVLFDGEDGSSTVTFEELHLLKLDSIFIDSLLPYIRCPNLKALAIGHLLPPPGVQLDSFDIGPSMNGIFKFIAIQSTITTLSIQWLQETDRIAFIAPQLKHLVASDVDEGVYSTPENDAAPSFPLLSSLTIDDMSGAWTTVEFDRLVCARCLPGSHPRSKLLTSTPLERLAIITRKPSAKDPIPWSLSDLFSDANIDVSPMEAVNTMVIVTMSWVGALLDGRF